MIWSGELWWRCIIPQIMFLLFTKDISIHKTKLNILWTFPSPDVFKRRIFNLKCEGLVLETTALWMRGSHFVENGVKVLYIKGSWVKITDVYSRCLLHRSDNLVLAHPRFLVYTMQTRLHPSPLWREFRTPRVNNYESNEEYEHPQK